MSLLTNDGADQNIHQVSWSEKPGMKQITLRGTVAGIVIGSVVLISNFQFGLQTGWVSMMSLPAALLGFAIFKLTPLSNDFSDVENVYVQSIAVAVGTGPLAYGLVGIIPAMEKFLTVEESGLHRKLEFTLVDLLLWCLGLAFFGVFFAIPLRKQVIVKEKLAFPSGCATGILISVLHGTKMYEDETGDDLSTVNSSSSDKRNEQKQSYESNLYYLLVTFLVSAFYTVASYFIPILKALPIFGSHASQAHNWNFQPSPAYIGQGIIMGLHTVYSMLMGAILGWGILAPLAKYNGWAPGRIDDWKCGGQGWIMWISLSIMISDSIVSFIVVVGKSIYNFMEKKKASDLERQALLNSNDNDNDSNNNSANDVDEKFLVSNKSTLIGVIVSSLVCAISIKLIFKEMVPLYAIFMSIVLALFFSILAVRALGETDLNPVSGIGKLSQLIFAFIIPSNHPSRIVINLIAGSVAEAGAQQAGDLMQDLKAGHLIGASPRAQFVAQMIGTVYSIFLSSIMYKVYNSVYDIPSSSFRIPTAVIWIDCARLVTGEGLPPKVYEFSVMFGIIFGIISLIKNTITPRNKYHKYLTYIPSGVALGIGIYNTPNFTLARFVGGVVSYFWMNNNSIGNSKDRRITMVIQSSGLVLGEGLMSGFTMILTSLGVKQL